MANNHLTYVFFVELFSIFFKNKQELYENKKLKVFCVASKYKIQGHSFEKFWVKISFLDKRCIYLNIYFQIRHVQISNIKLCHKVQNGSSHRNIYLFIQGW